VRAGRRPGAQRGRGARSGGSSGGVRESQLGEQRAGDGGAAAAHAPDGHQPLAVPPPALRAEVVVAHPAAARARVEDAPAAGVERDVADRLAGLGEHHQVAGAGRVPADRAARARGGLLPRRARQLDPLAAVDVLHVARAVEAGARRRAAPAVRDAQVVVGRGEGARADGRAAGGRDAARRLARGRVARRRLPARQRAAGEPLGAGDGHRVAADAHRAGGQGGGRAD
jgi:hypothetical protein